MGSCRCLGKYNDTKISCIPNNMEIYISFSLNNLGFIDSLQFLSSSIVNLVNTLKSESIAKLDYTISEFGSTDSVELITRKAVHPHDFMGDFS